MHYFAFICITFHLHYICISFTFCIAPRIDIFALHFINISYIWHFEMLTHINLGSHFFHFWGGLPKNHMVCRVVLLLLLQQQQDELDNGDPSMRSPYDNEGRWQRD